MEDEVAWPKRKGLGAGVTAGAGVVLLAVPNRLGAGVVEDGEEEVVVVLAMKVNAGFEAALSVGRKTAAIMVSVLQ